MPYSTSTLTRSAQSLRQILGAADVPDEDEQDEGEAGDGDGRGRMLVAREIGEGRDEGEDESEGEEIEEY